MASLECKVSNYTTQSPIPNDLRSLLPKPQIPWMVSQKLFDRMEKTNFSISKVFKTCEVLKSDPEYAFILKYFSFQKPPGLSIKGIQYIHNPKLTRLFEMALLMMEETAKKFLPTNTKEEALKRWNEQCNQFFPLEMPSDVNNSDRLVHVKVLPLWHGTKDVELISSVGFWGAGNFSKGIYFANSSHYATLQDRGTLLLSWISMWQPCKESNTFFIPVTAVDAMHLTCEDYTPCSENEKPLLDLAVITQSIQALPQFCIELCADMTISPSANGKNALHLAAEAGNTEAVLELSMQQALLDSRDLDGNTPLIIAAHFGRKECCEILLKANANPFLTNSSKSTALHEAASEGKIEIINLLLIYKDLLESRDSNQDTPFLCATSSGHLEASEVLLKAGANPFAKDKRGSNALHGAAANGKRKVVSMLLKYKELIEERNQFHCTPLNWAANYTPHYKVCKILLKGGAELHATNDLGRNALHNAVIKGNTDVVKFLLGYKELLEVKEKQEGCTPLILAAYFGHPEICKILLKAGANPLATSTLGKNALDYAIANGKNEVVQILKKL